MVDHATLAATHYENFPVGSFLLPRHARVHMHRIYAFARTGDDLADEVQDAEALAAYRASLRAHLDGTPDPVVPLMRDLAQTIRERDLPESLFFDLLDAFATDLEVHDHDETSLMAYCRKSADPVGRLVLRLFGHDDPELDRLSDRICTALQIVNHLQDVGEDLRDRDRVYLPSDHLERFGVTREDLAAPTASPALREVIRLWTDRSVEWFREGWPLTRRVGGRLALELRAILHGVALVVGHLRRIDHDSLSVHIRLNRREKMRALGRALRGSRMPREFA